jgi:hypothetical protein
MSVEICTGTYPVLVYLILILLFLKLNFILDPRAPAGTLCTRTLVEHSGRVFR